MSALIVYKDVAVGAKENSAVTASEKQDFVNLNDFKQDIQAVNYATLEKNMWLLDGSFNVLDDAPENVGYWSKQLSNSEPLGNSYLFETPITIERTFNGKYFTKGISFEFDVFNNVYATRINVLWWYNGSVVGDDVIFPDKTRFFYPKEIELFDKITISFYGLNKPNRYMRLFNIDDGTVRYIGEGYDNQIISGETFLNISVVGDNLQINSLDFDFRATTNEEFEFQEKQPLLCYKNEKLLGTFYVSDYEQLAKDKYSINAEDYISVLEKQKFYGGLYRNEPMPVLIAKIFEDENIDYTLDESFNNILINGYLPICSKREALRQIAIATGAVMSTANSTMFNILKLSESEPKTINVSRIKTGGKLTTNGKYTGVKLLMHGYSGYIELGSTIVYDGVVNGTATIEFDAIYDNVKLHSDSGATAELLEVSVNHAIVKADNERVKLIGSGILGDTTRLIEKHNTEIAANVAKNIVEITDATLVTKENAEQVLDRIYNYFLKNKIMKTEFVAENEQLGDNIKIQNEFSGEKTGTIITTNISLSGNKTFLDCEVLLDG